MNVKIWSDFVCPYCYAGKEQLKHAIEELDADIEMEILSYELAPGVEDNNTMKMADVLESQFGMSKEDLEKNNKQVETMIDQAGLEINSEKLKFSNTLKAHTLLQYFKEQGQGIEFADAVFNAYFAEGAYLNKMSTLVDLATKFGIDEEKVKEITNSKQYINKVHEEQELGKESKVQAVPHVLIDNKNYLSGAQSKDVYLEALKEALK